MFFSETENLLACVSEYYDRPIIMFILELLDEMDQVSIFDFLRSEDESLIQFFDRLHSDRKRESHVT